MSGSIFVYNEGNLHELKEQKYENEDLFQALIERYPSLLAGDQINPDNPRKWIFISREMGVPSQVGGSAQWFLDHLFIDQDAIPTFIEVKRSSDTRIRREVVAQMLDYAANGVEYWPVDMLRSLYESNGGKLIDDIGINEDEEDGFWERVENNLKNGKLRLLFVTDEIPESLLRIIEFLNNQMSITEVLGIEIKQYISQDEMKTYVPNVLGNTSQAKEVKRRSKGNWDEESFLYEVMLRSDEKAVKVCRKLIEVSRKHDCRLWWGEGKKHPSFMPLFDGKLTHRLFSIYPFTKNTNVEIQFINLHSPFRMRKGS